MAHSQHDRDTSPRRKGRDIIVALTVAVVLVAGWLWYDFSRGALSVDALVTGVLFMATVLVGMRCLDVVFEALAARYRLRRQFDRFDRKADALRHRLDQIERP